MRRLLVIAVLAVPEEFLKNPVCSRDNPPCRFG